MTYQLLYTHKSIRDMDVLDQTVKQRIGKTPQRFEPNPLAMSNRLDNRNWDPIGFGSKITLWSSI